MAGGESHLPAQRPAPNGRLGAGAPRLSGLLIGRLPTQTPLMTTRVGSRSYRSETISMTKRYFTSLRSIRS